VLLKAVKSESAARVEEILRVQLEVDVNWRMRMVWLLFMFPAIMDWGDCLPPPGSF